MLNGTKEIMGTLRGCALQARDGTIGRCKDLLFDDQSWIVRYLVVDTGGWLRGRKVVLSPIVVGEPDASSHELPVRLTRSEIENAPPLDEHAPVSRKYEIEIGNYFSTLPYWVGGEAWGNATYPGMLWQPNREATRDVSENQVESLDAPNLRSAREVTGYDVLGRDDRLGDVNDFILDDADWALRYLVVDTGRWLPGRKVLVSSDRVLGIGWAERCVRIATNRRLLETGPVYEPPRLVDRAL